MVKWLQSHKETPLQRRVAGGNPVGFVRLIADFRGTQFYMRNGLRMKRLERRGLKNSPPASAYARVFSETYLFGKQPKVKMLCMNLFRYLDIIGLHTPSPRPSPQEEGETSAICSKTYALVAFFRHNANAFYKAQ